MTDKDNDILMRIMYYCERVKEDIAKLGNTYEDFVSNLTFRDSVSMNILQIGELANKLSNDFKDSTRQEVPWEQLYAMRNRFAHGYGDMNFDIVWDTATYDVPKLLAFCEKTVKYEE